MLARDYQASSGPSVCKNNVVTNSANKSIIDKLSKKIKLNKWWMHFFKKAII